MATRAPTVWLLSREVTGDGAVGLVAAEFARLGRITGKVEAAYRETPAWNVEQVKLDAPKVLTLGLTR